MSISQNSLWDYQEKRCSMCQQIKPGTEEFFHKRTASKDGLTPICKPCACKKSARYKSEKRKTRPQKPESTHCKNGHPRIAENQRIHSGKKACKVCHREQEKARSASKMTEGKPKKREGYCLHGHPLIEGNLRAGKKRGQCLTCHRLSGRKRYHENPQKMVAKASIYAKTHRDQINARIHEYRRRNSPKVRARTSSLRKRAKKNNPSIAYTDERLYDDKVSQIHISNLLKDCCCYCGKSMEHIDHIIPVSKNGDEHWTNLTASCQRCNSRKNNKSLLEFLLYRLEYPD